MSTTDPIANSPLNSLAGAEFYKCALQVNPHGYAEKYRGQKSTLDQASYVRALVDKAEELGIRVLAITDHNHVGGVAAIRAAAQERNITVFPGFELASNDGGIHVLCLYPPKTTEVELNRFLGGFGIEKPEPSSIPCKEPFSEILGRVRNQGGIPIAAHVTNENGLLKMPNGQWRIRAWRDENLYAIQIPGRIQDLPDSILPIVQNKDPNYVRKFAPEAKLAIAVINAGDVACPDDLANPSSTCFVKMSEVSIEGLRQAFLDPGSRIRLNSDPVPEEHSELVEMAWQGGFLDGTAFHFNPNLNVLVGGRGAGKSTVVESLRYVLDLEPLGDAARSNHEGILKNALGSGTKVSLTVRSYRPSPRSYRIERTFPSPPIVRDAQTGGVLNISISDIFPDVEVYGQHEIAELARSPEKLTQLLERFIQRDESLDARKRNLRIELKRSREKILRTQEELTDIEDRLTVLPGLQETQKRYREAGIEEDLKERSLLLREKRLLDTVSKRLEVFRGHRDELKHTLPIDRAFLLSKALEDLPGKDILAEADRMLEALNAEMDQVVQSFDVVIDSADKKHRDVQEAFKARSTSVQMRYEQKLRDLQKSKIDGEEFIELRRRIEGLQPLTERYGVLRRQGEDLQSRRRNLAAEWADVLAEEFRSLDRASKRVTKQLDKRARVHVEFGGNREPLFSLLRDKVGGRLSEAIGILREADQLSPSALALACREGMAALKGRFRLTGAQAERLARASNETLMRLEELDLPSITDIELNVSASGGVENWQALGQLSTGQKATAVLLLLLLDSDAPLVVDQPEDDLDNRFITDGIVPRMRDGKRRRQFVFSTHNANIPVLGDAELILGLTASGEADDGRAKIVPEHRGSIDVGTVKELVEELLEGGEEAFERRRRKYGF